MELGLLPEATLEGTYFLSRFHFFWDLELLDELDATVSTLGTEGVGFPTLPEDLEIGVERFLEALVVLLPYNCSLASNNSKIRLTP